MKNKPVSNISHPVTQNNPKIKAETIAEALGGRRSGNGWIAKCPAHDDRNPSLSVSEENGKVLVKCHAGCAQDAVIEALRAGGLWPAHEKNDDPLRPPGIPARLDDALFSRAWEYTDPHGNTLGFVVRYDGPQGKTIRPAFVRDHNGRWELKSAPKPWPLYRLQALAQNPDAPVVVCEGEKAADAASRLFPRHIATSNLHGAGKAKHTDWTPLQGRHVLVWPDNDKVGIKHALEVARLVREAGATDVRIIDPAALGLPEKGDAADWPEGKPLPDPLPLMGEAETIRAEASDDEPPDPLPPLPPWPVEAFFEPYARLILEVSESFAVPVEVAAAAFLSVAGACVGRTRTIYAGRDWYEPCILWLALVAATGLGKTPATGFLLKPIFNAEKRWWDQYRKDLARYEQALEDWKAQKKKERGPKPEPPSYEQLVVDDATTEALTDALGNNPRGILWNRDELSGLLLDLDRYAPVQGGSKARLLSAYDAGPWKVTRVAASRRALIPHAAVSIFGTIQPQVLPLAFAKTDLVSGFLPRFQMILVERDRPPLWTEARVSHQTSVAWNQTVDHLLALKFESEGNPGVVRLSVEAKKRFIEWHDKVACLPWTDPRGESLEPFLTKMRGRALRLVLLFHELACFLDKKPDCDTTVSLDTLERALLVADTFIAHQERALAHLSKVEIPGLPPLQRRIAEAIVSLADRIEGGVIPTAMVTEKVNEGADERFYVTAHSVGKGVKGLGLHTKLARYAGAPGRCVMVSPKDIARLKNLISPHANVTGVTAVTNQDAAMVSWRNTSEAKRYKCYTAPRGEEADPVTLVTLENGSVTPIEPHESRESNRCNVCNASEVEDENQTPEADDEVEVII